MAAAADSDRCPFPECPTPVDAFAEHWEDCLANPMTDSTGILRQRAQHHGDACPACGEPCQVYGSMPGREWAICLYRCGGCGHEWDDHSMRRAAKARGQTVPDGGDAYPPTVENDGRCCLCGRDRGGVSTRVFAVGLIETCQRCYVRWLDPAAGRAGPW